MAAADIILVGAGGHARVLIDVLRRAGFAPTAAVDLDARLHGRAVDGVPVIGGDDAIYARAPSGLRLVSAVGNIPSGQASGLAVRRAAYERFSARGYAFMTVISRDAVVSAAAVLEDGAQVITGAIVHPGAVIGAGAIINTGARVDHDCVVGAHSHVAPGAILCGGVRVGTEAHVGAGAVVIPGIAIGSGAVIGAGAVVTADVAGGSMVLGIPARAPGRV